MMFFPLVALAVYKIYSEDVGKWQVYRKNALILAIGMSGLICTHILSTQMITVMLVLLCLLFLNKTFRKNTIKVYLKQ